jgi:hypothetical protein
MSGYANGFCDLGNNHLNLDTVTFARSSDPSNLSKYPFNQTPPSQVTTPQVPQGSLASSYSSVPIAPPAPPTPAMPLKINAALPPHPPK